MATITDLKPCRREIGRVRVYLDGEPAFSVSLSDSADLERGMSLAQARIDDYRESELRWQAHRAALRYLAFRSRTTRQVSQELVRRGHSSLAAAATVERLQEQGLLNDADYARRYVCDRLRLKPRSSSLLRQELRRKGIAGSEAEAALDPVDDEAVARRIVEQQWFRWQRLPRERRKTKVLGYLKNRGFSRDICMRAYRFGCSLPQTSA